MTFNRRLNFPRCPPLSPTASLLRFSLEEISDSEPAAGQAHHRDGRGLGKLLDAGGEPVGLKLNEAFGRADGARSDQGNRSAAASIPKSVPSSTRGTSWCSVKVAFSVNPRAPRLWTSTTRRLTSTIQYAGMPRLA